MTYALNSNIIIEGNSIDHGIFNNGTGNTTYTYDQSAWVFGSAIMTYNSFFNPSASSDMVNITDGSCIVRNNKFFRNGKLINSYIKHHYSDAYTYSGLDEITDNIFDSSDIGDGYTTELVKGLNPGTVYTRNRNQTGKIYIPLADSLYGNCSSIDIDGISSIDVLFKNSSTFTGVQLLKYGYNLITDIQTDDGGGGSPPTTVNLTRGFNLSQFLEKGMSITNVRIGAYMTGGNITDFILNGQYFGLILKSHDPADSMDATKITTTIYDNSIEFQYPIQSSTDVTNLKSGTQFTIPYGGSSSIISGGGSDFYGFVEPDYYRIGNGYDIELDFRLVMTFTDAGWEFEFTPIEITYVW